MVKQFIYIFLLVAIITIALYLVYDEYIEGYRLIGTFDDHAERILGTSDPNKQSTVTYADECNSIAATRNHPYFGLESNKCYTGHLIERNNTYSPSKITDYNGARLPNNATRSTINESNSINAQNGGPGDSFKVAETKYRDERRTKPKPRPDYRYIAAGPWGFGAMMSKFAVDMDKWNRDKYYTVRVSYTDMVQRDRINELTATTPNTTIPTSTTDSSPNPAGGNLKMSIYRADPLTTNSTSGPDALSKLIKYDYFTVREGLEPDMDTINKKYGFQVSDINSFLPYLIDNIGLATKIFSNATTMVTPSTGDYRFKGYYTDSSDRGINDEILHPTTWEQCKKYASNKNYTYFAMQYGNQCFLGNSQKIDSSHNPISQAENPTPAGGCSYNPQNKYGSHYGGAWCNAVWTNEPSTETKTEYIITIDQYETFIKNLIQMGVNNESEFRDYVNKNKQNFTTIREGITTINNVNNNIVNAANQVGLNLPENNLYDNLGTVHNLTETSNMFTTISQYGVKDLSEWTQFREVLAKVGNIDGVTDIAIVNKLRNFGYFTFKSIPVSTFAEKYSSFGFDKTCNILESFDKITQIGVYESKFLSFSGANGVKQFETSDYPVNAKTFFNPGENGGDSLYLLFRNIGFKYDENTFLSFIQQIKSMGLITSEIKITTSSSQEDLKRYVLHISINKNINIIRKFRIFVTTINSIGIHDYDTYTGWMTRIHNLKIIISDLQLCIEKFRYFYIFLSSGLNWSYDRGESNQIADFVNNTPVNWYWVEHYWDIMRYYMEQIKNIPKFHLENGKDFESFLNRAIENGWSYDTIVTDSNIGNSHTDFMKQGFSTIADTISSAFSSISETFVGKEYFTQMNVNDEQVHLRRFRVVPMNKNNAELLSLFKHYAIEDWQTIMQYIVRMNRLSIPFKIRPGPDPSPATSSTQQHQEIIPIAQNTLELFERFRVNWPEGGLDLFDHLFDTVKIVSSTEMFRFLNKLMEFGVDYSTYYEFMMFFDESHFDLKYSGVGENHEIFYMFIDDLIALSNNGTVKFNYTDGRTNFETLMHNIQCDMFANCNGTNVQIYNGKHLSLNTYQMVLRNILYIFYNYDKMVSEKYNCSNKICNELIDWVTPRKSGSANSTYQFVLQPYIDITGQQKADLNEDGKPSSKEKVFINSGVHSVFRYIMDSYTPLNDTQPIPSISAPQLRDTHSLFDIAFCIKALDISEYNTMKNCQYNYDNDRKLNLINAMIPKMIQKNTADFNTDQTRTASTIPTYNHNVNTINFLILYPLFAFEVIVGAISNPCGIKCPSYPGENYDSIADPKNAYTFQSNAAVNNNLKRDTVSLVNQTASVIPASSVTPSQGSPYSSA